jgi:hypothetical protein
MFEAVEAPAKACVIMIRRGCDSRGRYRVAYFVRGDA